MTAARRLPEPKPIAGRLPPHDLDAEAAVLSAVLVKPETLDDVSDLESREFYSEANAMVFEAITDLHAHRQPVDLVTVAAWLRERDKLMSIGGPGYLAEVCDSTPAVWNIRAHVDIVKRKARRRQVIATAHAVLAEGYWDLDGQGEDDWLAGVGSRFDGHEKLDGDAVHVGDAMRRAWAERSSNATKRHLGPSTGLRDLDARIGGLRGGKMTTVAARSGIGKTALAFQAATTVAATGGGVLVFELEAPEDECVDRLLYAAAGVDGSPLLEGRQLSREDNSAITEAAERLNRSELWMVTRSTFTASQIRAEVKRAVRSYERMATKARAEAKATGCAEPVTPRLELVVVDYVQLVSSADIKGGAANREAAVSHVSREMKRLAMDHNLHVMLLSQLNKDGDKRGADTRPRTSDMRESSAVENDSDHIVLIYNPHALARSRGERTEQFDEVELILGKNRGGKPGTIFAQWWPGQQSFRCVDRQEWDR